MTPSHLRGILWLIPMLIYGAAMGSTFCLQLIGFGVLSLVVQMAVVRMVPPTQTNLPK